MVIAFTCFDCYSEIHSHLSYSSDDYKAHIQMKTDFSNMISGKACSLKNYLLVIPSGPQNGLQL